MPEDEYIESIDAMLHLEYPVPHVMPIDDYLLPCLNFEIFDFELESESETEAE